MDILNLSSRAKNTIGKINSQSATDDVDFFEREQRTLRESTEAEDRGLCVPESLATIADDMVKKFSGKIPLVALATREKLHECLSDESLNSLREAVIHFYYPPVCTAYFNKFQVKLREDLDNTFLRASNAGFEVVGGVEELEMLASFSFFINHTLDLLKDRHEDTGLEDIFKSLSDTEKDYLFGIAAMLGMGLSIPTSAHVTYVGRDDRDSSGFKLKVLEVLFAISPMRGNS